MYLTVEVRWFYPGAAPPEVVDWFRQGEQEPEQQRTRVDYYLRLSDDGDLGVKLREGNIEVKQRQRKYGVAPLHERVAGRVEAWRKWSYPLAVGFADLGSMAVPASNWTGVRKERALRKYAVTAEGQVVAVPIVEYAPRGCTVELAAIHVHGGAWWSLAYEAFGDETAARENLVLVAAHVLAAHCPPALEAERSCGYPQWLRTIQMRDH